MMHSVLALLLVVSVSASVAAQPATIKSTVLQRPSGTPPVTQAALDLARWETTAKRVTIIRDNFGIPHIYAKTDADVVFGALYAQAEDDFHRIERNYINAMGRLAETAGEKELYRDLRMKLFIDPADMKRQYALAPLWLRKLMNGFADGLNYYLHTHPEVKPEVITRFEPWMALTFSEGSIGGDIESVSLPQLEALYGKGATVPTGGSDGAGDAEPAFEDFSIKEPSGSNGFAIAPSNTTGGKSLLLINPHTSFYFRAELQMVSEEGLNAYGASTWGQFFIYQGFNNRLGWMHTSGGADVIDEYKLTVSKKADGLYYKHGASSRKLREKKITLPYKAADGSMASKVVTVFYSHQGPVVRQADGQWIAVQMMNEPLKALTQSYQRTKATTYAAFNKVMDLRTNSSNNTVYADADGNIAYWHGNFAPRRNTRFDWSQPVDGSDLATDWKGLHLVSETITLFNPKTGWIQNTNSTPFTSSGPSSPRRENYPNYMAPSPENARGIHAVRVLKERKDFTVDKLIGAAFDPDLPAFDDIIPPLLRDFDALPATDARKRALAEPIDSLRRWNRRWGAASVPMSLADYWGNAAIRATGRAARAKGISTLEYLTQGATVDERLEALTQAVATLTRDFGTWKKPWGDINRFQRLTNDLDPPYDDDKPSVPVPFASATWGSLAAYGNTAPKTTKKNYGNRGNSFVAAVEFGSTVKAKAVSAGGQSGNPSSPHFADQIERYANGNFRDVLFYRADVEKQAESTYNPGTRPAKGTR